MGALYLAEDPRLDRSVAIKLLKEDSDELRERFAREARTAARLRHNNIVWVFDVDEFKGQPFIAMEYIPGETLAEMIRRRAPIALGRKLQMMEDLCSGLAYAHRAGIIHRDVKPANIMVDSEGTLKILDFGIARLGTSSMTVAGTLMGTLNYMSPEQVVGHAIDARSDIFAVGAVFYELVTYKKAFPGAAADALAHILHRDPEPAQTLVPGLDPAIGQILARALSKDAAKRYQDLAAMRRELIPVRLRIEAEEPESPTIVIDHSEATIVGRGRPRSAAAQVAALLANAAEALKAGDVNAAQAIAAKAAQLDPAHAGVLRLQEQIHARLAEGENRQMLEAVRRALDDDALTRAGELLVQLQRSVPEWKDVGRLAADLESRQTSREREKARKAAVRVALDRARQQLAQDAFEAALRATDEALTLAPNDSEAEDLARRAQIGIDRRLEEERRIEEARRAAEARRAEEQRRREAEEAERRRLAEEAERRRLAEQRQRELDAGAKAALEAARVLFVAGKRQEAIASLRAFTPLRGDIDKAIADWTAEAAEIERKLEETRQREEAERRREAEEEERRRQAAEAERQRAEEAERRRVEAERQREEQRQRELDARAQAAVAEARAMFDGGSREAALQRLRAFTPAHQSIIDAIGAWTTEAAEIERRIEEARRQETERRRLAEEAEHRRKGEEVERRRIEEEAERRRAAEEAERRKTAEQAEQQRAAEDAARRLAAEKRAADQRAEKKWLAEQRAAQERAGQRQRELARQQEEEERARGSAAGAGAASGEAAASAESEATIVRERVTEPTPSVPVQRRGVPHSSAPPVILSGVGAIILIATIIGGLVYRGRISPAPPELVPTGPQAGGPIKPTPSPPTDQTPSTPSQVPLIPVAIDSVPWARVTITSASPDAQIEAIEQITPFVVNLPPGDYTAKSVNDQMPGPFTQQFRVVAGRENRITIKLPAYDPEKVLTNILGGR
jgi:eukaryotic-like serine/threonine-protein kinase